MNDKRTGRPPFGDGYERRAIGIRCTEAEFAAILDGLTSRGRTEAMLDKIAAQAADELWQPYKEME